MKMVFTAIVILLFFIGCKKSSENDPGIVHGIILDIDSRTPIANATVILDLHTTGLYNPIDSFLSDINGRFSFTDYYDGIFKGLIPKKNGYVDPIGYYFVFLRPRSNWEDTIYLAKPSFIRINLHEQGIYQNTDSIILRLKGNIKNTTVIFPADTLHIFYQNKAVMPDTSLNMSTYYDSYYSKIYLQWDIKRNGSIISTQTDSTDLIQYGTKNFDLNY